MKLSQRLHEIINLVPENSRIADIGSDHAFVPIELIKTGKISYAIASEVAKGPLSISKENIEAAGLAQQIDTRLGDGLSAIVASDKIDTFIIAGMGGELITHILQSAAVELLKNVTLILEPNNQEIQVRQLVNSHHWGIQTEKIIFDEGHYYEMMRVDTRFRSPGLDNLDLKFGPILRRRKSLAFTAKWQHRLAVDKKVLEQLSQAKTIEFTKIQQVQQEIQAIQEVLI